jgi:predicted DNA-binding WGR domain protein
MAAEKNQTGKTQAQKFADKAKELGCAESEKAFEKALKGLADVKPESPKKAAKKSK